MGRWKGVILGVGSIIGFLFFFREIIFFFLINNFNNFNGGKCGGEGDGCLF